MSLITTLISGGALLASAKLYKENNRKKETLWELYPKRVGVINHKKELTQQLSISSFLKEAQNTAIDKMQAMTQLFKQDRLAVFSARREQIEEFVGDQISEEEKQMNRRFTVALGNLGLAGISLFYPPLLWLTVPVIIYTSIPFYRLAYKDLIEEKRISSYVLDAALMIGMLFGRYFYTEVIATCLGAFGRKLLLQSEHNTQKSLSNLFGTPPHSVWVLTDEGIEVEIPFEELQRGDIVMVSAGQAICVDGVITTGFASIDQHKLTGESQPVEKGAGEPVLASTVVLAGRIGIRTEKTGEETVAMQIGQILDQTASFKNSLQSQGEAIADRLVLPTLGLSTLFLPLFGYTGALAVLTNTFGYKMRIFAPASMLTFLNIASQEGILIKDGRSLELLNQVDTIVFDKTGTLTLEQPTVGQIHTYHGYCEEDVLRYAAAAEDGQTHPIAKAILAAANGRQLEWPKLVNARYEMGYGI